VIQVYATTCTVNIHLFKSTAVVKIIQT